MATAVRLATKVADEPRFPALRVGVHAGPVVERGGDVFGATVNVAARVTAHARGGQILCTSAVEEALRESPYSVRPAGEASFKNVVGVVSLYEIGPVSPPSLREFVDPICRMRLSVGEASAESMRHGVHFLFCSDTCVGAFDRQPA